MNREDFEILNDVIYLDNAATSQKPRYVLDEVMNYYKNYNANIHRGNYNLSVKSTIKYDEARKRVADYINANNSEIVFTKNATESINLVAYSYLLDNLKEDDEVVVSILEHHSNLVPWQEICKRTKAKLVYLNIDENYDIPSSELLKINDKTKLVAITHISNVLGSKINVEEIVKIAHKRGAKVLVDASQSIAHTKIDVKKLDADFLVFSAHKMYALTGIGVLYVKEDILKNMKPFIMGGDMIDYVSLDNTTYLEGYQRFEAGTQNVGGAVSLKAAIDYIESIGMEKIEEYERELTSYALEKLNKLDFIETYFPKNSSSIIAFNIKGVHSHDVSTMLDSYNVAIRSGLHCAHPLHKYLNLNSTCRLSISFYNNKNDIDKLIDALIKINEKFKNFKSVK